MSRKRKRRTLRTICTGVLVLGVLVAGALPAGASHRKISGEFVASAEPLPGLYFMWNEDGPCPYAEEGAHKVSHPLTAPFRGWLSVVMDFPAGAGTEACWITWLCDWDLYLTNTEGKQLANSGYQRWWGEPREELDYFLEKGQEVLIVACNEASTDDAHVQYELTHGRGWPSPAGKGKWERVEELNYISPAAATTSFHVICHVGFDAGCVGTPPHAGARWVSIEIDDAVSPDVAGGFYQYRGSTYVGGGLFCTTTDEPLRLQPRVDFVGVVLYTGPCTDGTPAQATRGTVTMTFTNR